MDHWAQKYVGRPYTRHREDCAHFVHQVLLEETGRDVCLPTHISWRRTPAQRVAHLAHEFAEQVDTPECFDGVLMKFRGHRRSLGSHIGIYAPLGPQAWVLHSIEKMGSMWTAAPNLVRMGLEIVGYYRWK